MKRITVLLLVLMLILLVGCGNEEKPPENITTTTTTTITTTTAPGKKENSPLCGEWRTEYELLDTHELLTLTLNLNEDGTVTYKYGYYLGDIIENFTGMWEEEDDKLYLELFGGPVYTDEEPPLSGAYDNSCVYKFELEETGLSLRRESGGTLVYGSKGREIFFKPAE